MNMDRLNYQQGNLERSQTNGSSTTRETYLRQSYVFSNAVPYQQRSFISSSLVNDSLAFGDDLRKYFLTYLDPVSKICPTTRRPT